MAETLPPQKAPFPYFGAKSRIAPEIWERFGDTLNYVEPFCGSIATLLTRPFPVRTETINDIDPHLINFWRAVKFAPDEVAEWANFPVTEVDLHSRHRWLMGLTKPPDYIPPKYDTAELRPIYIQAYQDIQNPLDLEAFTLRIKDDPDYYSTKAAGWWVWGISAWIGSGWCSQNNHRPGGIPSLPKRGTGRGVHGVSNQRPNLRPKQGVEALSQQVPEIRSPHGVHAAKLHQKRVDIRRGSRGSANLRANIYDTMRQLFERLRHVRVVCGDWSRVCGPSVTYKIGKTAVLLDPPYTKQSGRQMGLYAHDSDTVATAVRKWCLEEIEDNGGSTSVKYKGPRYNHPNMRIALCGYAGEGHEVLEDLGWEVLRWETGGGYGNQKGKSLGKNKNAKREVIYFSPHCLKPERIRQGQLL